MAVLKTRCAIFLRTRNESGTAAIEFALLTPFLALLLTATVELSLAMYEAMQVSNAVESGMLYATKNGWNSAAITSAVVGASALPAGMQTLTATPAPSEFCGCPTVAGISNSGAPTAGSCRALPTCGDGTTPGLYVRVNAALNHTTVFANSLGLPATFTAQAVVRIN